MHHVARISPNTANFLLFKKSMGDLEPLKMISVIVNLVPFRVLSGEKNRI